MLKPRAGEAVNFLLSASATEGLIVELADGSRATLGVIGPDGQVIADDVTREAFAVAVQAYVEFLRGRGHMRVHRSPPGQITT
ncbi:hypothetical protein DWV00_29620 [Trinickia dinghuensis]|uniref:Uncharacterized protein n=1 Tax=Trinickia dinghuensis TaxID=2291023 RepID=A0A3D8JQL4_9BURK|nr:hypothetical protein DWV00_29620 [Trinickia dinghuensis]